MRKTIHWSRTVLTMAATLVVTATAAIAQFPVPSPADADYGASGFVTPAGMPPMGAAGIQPAMYSAMQGLPPGGVMHAGGMAMPGPGPGSNVMPAGYMGGGAGSCDNMGCDCLGYGCNRCNGGAVGSGGILQRMHGGGGGGRGCGMCGGCGCGSCLSDYAAQLGIGRGGLIGMGAGLVDCLLPFSEGGQCAQRWYDVSAEVLVLGRNGDGGNSGVVSQQGLPGTPVLFVDSAGLDELEAGIRLSGAIIMGPGGSVEVTYMGSNKWEGNAVYNSVNPDLYSFISDFGTTPAGGFADADQAVRHAIRGEANFHSGEVNYRRRTVTPDCRFQCSWLAGLRYIRLDDALTFQADTQTNNGGVITTQRSLNLTTDSENDLFGVQIGGDLWWNVVPGVNLGCGLKLGLLDNDVDRVVFASGSSLGAGGTAGTRTSEAGYSETTGMIDFNTTLIYRFSHSWAFRGSYHVLAIDEVAAGFDSSMSNALLQTPQTASTANIEYGSMVLSGFALGAEYTW